MEQMAECFRDYVYPIAAGAILHHSHSRNQPFEIQFVGTWIAQTIVSESHSQIVKVIPCILTNMYAVDFWRSLHRASLMHSVHPEMGMTWMQSMDIVGKAYLATLWFYHFISTLLPRYASSRHQQRFKKCVGLAYVILSLILYKRFRPKRTMAIITSI